MLIMRTEAGGRGRNRVDARNMHRSEHIILITLIRQFVTFSLYFFWCFINYSYLCPRLLITKQYDYYEEGITDACCALCFCC